eukprot:s1561_g11.t1
MFISHQYRLKHVKCNEHEWDIKMTLHRTSGKELVYHFRKSPHDILSSLFQNYETVLDIYEMGDDVPCLLLMCAEEQSLITKNHYKDKFKLMHVVTITEDDNLLSPFGRAKWKRCLRSSADCVFFAGPCTGGSPWNRLNKNINEVTAHNIHMKAVMYWELWEEFAKCLHKAIQMSAMALLELPRGCDYWTDERMTALINGTDSHIHEFDGCMYGLVSRYKDAGTPIKKPWRIVSWGVSFKDLNLKCDGSHEHGQCAGRETRVTQWKGKSLAIVLRATQDLRPETGGRGVITDMATDEGKTLIQGARAVKTMYAVLEEINKRGVSHQLPPRFTTYAQGPPCPDAGIEMWINRVKVPVVIVASLAFVSQRNKADSTLHAISLLVRTFRECKVQEEKDMLAEQYVRSAARIIKALINDYRGNPDRHGVYHTLMTNECLVRSDEMWSILKDQFPKLIEDIMVKDLLHKATTTTLDRLGSQASKTHPPPNGIVDRLRLGDLFFQDVIKVHWEKIPATTEMLDGDKIKAIHTLMTGVRTQLQHLGYALRRHNFRNRDNPKDQIIIQDCLKDWLNIRYNLPLERAAALTHLQGMVVATTILHAWAKTFRAKQFQHLRGVIQKAAAQSTSAVADIVASLDPAIWNQEELEIFCRELAEKTGEPRERRAMQDRCVNDTGWMRRSGCCRRRLKILTKKA